MSLEDGDVFVDFLKAVDSWTVAVQVLLICQKISFWLREPPNQSDTFTNVETQPTV